MRRKQAHRIRQFAMPRHVPALALYATLALWSSGASAFCIENHADAKLLFAARPENSASSDWSFFKWIKPGDKHCGRPQKGRSLVEVFVFVDEEALEGCDTHTSPTGTLRLQSFSPFDNCAWSE